LLPQMQGTQGLQAHPVSKLPDVGQPGPEHEHADQDHHGGGQNTRRGPDPSHQGGDHVEGETDRR
jgi:hypothetical protein